MNNIKFSHIHEVTSDGEVINFKTGRILKKQINGTGYYKVEIFVNKKMTTMPIHRIVAKSFLPNPDDKLTVNHIDGNRLNNKVENLEWATQRENNMHKIHVLKSKRGIRARLVLDFNSGVFYDTGKEVAKLYNIPFTTLNGKLCGQRRNNTPFRYV